MNKTLYTISLDMQSAITKLFHLTFLLDSPSNKPDHMLSIDEQMACTYQCKKPFKLTINQRLAAVTALKSVGRKVGLSTIQKNLQQIILENALTALLESIGLLTQLQIAELLQSIQALPCSKVCSASFIALKWKRDLLCLLAEIHEISPNAFLPFRVCGLRKLLKIWYA